MKSAIFHKLCYKTKFFRIIDKKITLSPINFIIFFSCFTKNKIESVFFKDFWKPYKTVTKFNDSNWKSIYCLPSMLCHLFVQLFLYCMMPRTEPDAQKFIVFIISIPNGTKINVSITTSKLIHLYFIFTWNSNVNGPKTFSPAINLSLWHSTPLCITLCSRQSIHKCLSSTRLCALWMLQSYFTSLHLPSCL